MKVTDLNGNIVNWPPKGHIVNANDSRPRSQGHILARAILVELFPFDVVLEEVKLPGTNLFFDFVIVSRRLIVEVDGEQHDNFSSFFHGDKEEFVKSKQRDSLKEEWSICNNFKLVRLKYNEDAKTWKMKIRS